MLRFTVFVALVAFASGKLTPRIIGGDLAEEGKYPYHALINTSDFSCGGAILDEYYIVTAAACVQKYPIQLVQVIVGTNKASGEGGEVRQVRAIQIHENYSVDRRKPINNIALILLKKPLVFNEKIQSIALPEQNAVLADATDVTLTGFGASKRWGEPAEELKRAQFQIHNQRDCKIQYFFGKQLDINDQMLCASSQEGKGACTRDEGGPLVANGVLQGIQSFHIDCGSKYPDVYTRVSSYVDWLKSNIE